MKKNAVLLVLISLLIFSLSFSGCKDQSSEKNVDKTVTNDNDKTGKQGDNTLNNKGVGSDTDEKGTEASGKNPENGKSEIGSGGNGEKKEAVEEPEPEPTDAAMDYVTQLEYDRSRLLAKTDYYDSLDNSCPNTWCFQRKKDHSPSGTYENFKISDYNSVYLNENVAEGDKVIYLTFDCGYPSDLTVKILDTLKKHNVKASFFVTKMYLEECADYAKRMKEEGHMVCNHTVTHTDLLKKSVEGIAAEIFDVAEYFYEVTGYTFDPYLRTPTGSYSKRLLSIIRDAGYLTVFWSIAYGDYDPKNQPEPGYVTNHFDTYHHNGAVALMHNDSPSNANELDAVLTLLEKEGYRFGLLNELDY